MTECFKRFEIKKFSHLFKIQNAKLKIKKTPLWRGVKIKYKIQKFIKMGV